MVLTLFFYTYKISICYLYFNQSGEVWYWCNLTLLYFCSVCTIVMNLKTGQAGYVIRIFIMGILT